MIVLRTKMRKLPKSGIEKYVVAKYAPDDYTIVILTVLGLDAELSRYDMK